MELPISPLIFVVILFGVLALALVLLKRSGAGTRIQLPYERQLSLFTKAERSFLGVLEQVVGSQYRIYGKVRLCDIIKVRSGLTKSDRQSAFNRISKKHVDFVLCRSDDLSIVAVLELDDASHQRQDRERRDSFVDAALNAAGLPIVHVPVKQAYSLQEVRGLLTIFLTPSPIPRPQPAVPTSQEPVGVSEKQPCPKCGSVMIIKTARRGEHAGKQFLACSDYPSCRTLRSLEAQSMLM